MEVAARFNMRDKKLIGLYCLSKELGLCCPLYCQAFTCDADFIDSLARHYS